MQRAEASQSDGGGCSCLGLGLLEHFLSLLCLAHGVKPLQGRQSGSVCLRTCSSKPSTSSERKSTCRTPSSSSQKLRLPHWHSQAGRQAPQDKQTDRQASGRQPTL